MELEGPLFTFPLFTFAQNLHSLLSLFPSCPVALSRRYLTLTRLLSATRRMLNEGDERSGELVRGRSGVVHAKFCFVQPSQFFWKHWALLKIEVGLKVGGQ
jgi:hypothetical protein